MTRAVIVGINTYAKFPNSSLQGCINDAEDVISYLTDVRGYANSDIMPLFDSRATKDAIVTALRDMIASSNPGDHLLFHYSGHGAQIASQDINEPDGLDECLCPYDFDWAAPSTALTDNELADILATVPDGAAMTVVLDSCHSGDTAKDPARRPRFLPPPLDVAFLLANHKRVVQRRSLTASRSVIVAACASNETAADTSFNGRPNGAFTYSWLVDLRAHAKSSLSDLVNDITTTLATFNMHPELEGDSALEQATFLIAPPPGSRALGAPRQAGRAPAQPVFDESWATTVLGTAIGVKLEISLVDRGFEFQLGCTAGVPLRWSFAVNGNTTQQFDLGFGFALILAVSGWQASPAAVGLDLGIRVAPPFFGPVTITQQRVTLPITTLPRSRTVPASPADLLAMIQLAQLGYSKEPLAAPPLSMPRDGDAQWTGIAAVEGFSGGLFGCSYNKNTTASTSGSTNIPFGVIRDHVEVVLNPPDSGNVHFNKWNDSDPHQGGFEFHVGCAAFRGGTATFFLHCVPDPAVVRQLSAVTAPVVVTLPPAGPTNGHAKPQPLGEALPVGAARAAIQ